MSVWRTGLSGSVAALAILFLSAPTATAADPVDYTKDVKPILAKNCAGCHGANKARGGLRLDTAAQTIQGGNSGPAVVAGKSADSLLVQSLTGAGDAPRMPPKGPQLPAAQIAQIKAWIDAGAKAPDEKAVAAADQPAKPAVGKRIRKGDDDGDDDDREKRGMRRRQREKERD